MVSEKSISTLENKIGIMGSEHDKQISGLDNKIETEIAKLLATYERYRNDIMKYAAGYCSLAIASPSLLAQSRFITIT